MWAAPDSTGYHGIRGACRGRAYHRKVKEKVALCKGLIIEAHEFDVVIVTGQQIVRLAFIDEDIIGADGNQNPGAIHKGIGSD